MKKTLQHPQQEDPLRQAFLPEAFVDRLQRIAGSSRFQETLASFSIPRPVAIRINTMRTGPEQVAAMLKKNNIRFKSVPWYTDALILPECTTRKVIQTELYTNGSIYIQGLSSMIPALVLKPQPGERVLDMAAAPGSKTTQMAAMMENTGEIVANDVSKARLYKLKDTIKRLGAANITVTNLPGQRLWERYQNYFDKVLLDAPCSLEGMFSLHDPATYSQWSLKKVKLLAKEQCWLLRSAISAARPGGTIVYSTCTLSPEENEGVIDWILRKEQGKIALESVIVPGCRLDSPLPSWGGRRYAADVAKTARIFPDAQREAFFIAKIRKKE